MNQGLNALCWLFSQEPGHPPKSHARAIKSDTFREILRPNIGPQDDSALVLLKILVTPK